MNDDKKLLNNVALNVRLERELAGVSVAELAEATGLSASYLYSLEKGDTNPGLDELGRISQALARSVIQLLSAPEVVSCPTCGGCGVVRVPGEPSRQ